MAPAPHGSLPPRLWLDNVDALLNEPVYKSVMYQRLESCSSEQELVLLEVQSRNATSAAWHDDCPSDRARV
jgi:hypothetical protein